MGIREKLSQFRLVRKRSCRLTKIVVCVAIVVSVLALLVLRSATLEALAKKEAWRQEAQQQEQEKNRWEELMENLGSIEGIRDIAELLLGLTDPDTVVIQPEN